MAGRGGGPGAPPLQHCLEMRNGPSVSERGPHCCTPCADDENAHLTPGAYRTTAELRPGDTVHAAGPSIRTVLVNDPPRSGSRWHVLGFRDGTTFWSASDDRWELVPPPAPEVQYAVRDTKTGKIWPMPDRLAAILCSQDSPKVEAVSRTVSRWEMLR